jgi:hypothetical protein
MPLRFTAIASFATLLVSAAAFAGGDLQNIALKWTPTSTFAEMGHVEVSGPMASAKIRFEPLVDTRQNPSLVAENREKPEKIRQVTTSSDVAAFVFDHLKDTLHGAGLNIVDGPADLIISGEIRQFFVTEVNTYGGEISVLIHVKNSAGKELWTGAAAGDSTRWGRSYKADNYYEAMSDMILRAAFNLLSTSGFRDALAKT